MLEVELKVSLADLSTDQIRDSAEKIGFQVKKRLREIDMYFNGNERDFRDTDEALRLRSCQDLSNGGPAQVFITYKGPKQDKVSSTRTEFETSVGELSTMRKLLEALGYQPMYSVDKTRTELCSGQVTLCLDCIEGLGNYLELEILAESEDQKDSAVQKLLSLLDLLQVPRDNMTRKSYLELLYFPER